MNVKQLIERLSALDGNALVVLARDEEGNGFAKLSDIGSNMKFDAQSDEAQLASLTDDLRKAGYTGEDVMEGGVDAIVLWP